MTNPNPLVSITMATYNVESFIKQSLNCIVNQTLQDIEIIIIDDGSTDGTLQILQQYALQDPRITVIAKSSNQGLAVSRNEALALAKGKYITFVDGDDLMDVKLFKKAYEKAEATNSDVVIWDYCTFYNEQEITKLKAQPSQLLKLSNTNTAALLQLPAFTWIKLIKTKVAHTLNIHFPVGLTRQDIPVHWQLLTSNLKISLLPERLSYYRQQPNATTHKKDTKLFDIAKVLDITKTYLTKSNQYQLYKNVFLKQQLNMLFGMYDTVEKTLKPAAFQLLREKLQADQWYYINSTEPLRKQARWFYKAINGNFVAKIKYQIWELARIVYRFLFKIESK